MERRLVEAALHGSETTLEALIQEDPLILDRVSLTCFNDTPLHIAALHGNLSFVIGILSRKPQFVTRSNSLGRYPLHLACAEGHLEIVKRLFQASPQVCQCPDQDGRTSLDFAALNDRVEVLAYLLQENPRLAISDSRETTLHLCIRYNSIGALKLLVNYMEKHDVVRCVDEDANTLLHLAVMHQQIETVKYLLAEGGFGENSNSLNKNGFTAIDVLDYCPRDLRSFEIYDMLVRAGVPRAKDLNSIPRALPASSSMNPRRNNPESVSPRTSNFGTIIRKFISNAWNNYLRMENNWIEQARGNLMVVAILAAGSCYQAAINPPGGVWQDPEPGNETGISIAPAPGEDSQRHQPGTSIAASMRTDSYASFMLYNTASLAASLSIVFLIIIGLPLSKKVFVAVLTYATCVSVVCLALAHQEAATILSPEVRRHPTAVYASPTAHSTLSPTAVYASPTAHSTYFTATYIYLIVAIQLLILPFGIVVFLHTVRALAWLAYRLYGLLKIIGRNLTRVMKNAFNC